MRKLISTLWTISAFTLVCPMLQAQARPVGPGKAKLPLVDELKQAYKLSRYTVRFGGEPAISYGAAFQLRQSGIMGLPRTNLAVAVATFENGTLRQPGWSDRMVAGENAFWFKPGDRLFADKFDVDTKRDRITFTLVNEDYSYKAGLHFKFPKGYLLTATADQIYEVIGQVIPFENAGNDQQQQQQQQPPQQQQTQQPPPSQPTGRAPYNPAPLTAPAAAAPPPAAAPSSGAAVAPLMFNNQIVGYGPAGVAMLPADKPPTGADRNSWVPLIRNGQILAYAPPGSTLFPQGDGSADAAASAPAAPAPEGPPTITLGMSGEEVQGILGTPEKIVKLGAKVIFVYKDLKVTLTDGKVTDVQ